MSGWMVGARAILIGGMAAVSTVGAQTPAPPPQWALTPFTHCRYDVDVRGLHDPYGPLGRVPVYYRFVCPFRRGQKTPIQVYSFRRGNISCLKSDLPGLSVLSASHLTEHEYDNAYKCTPNTKSSTPFARRAPGEVDLIVSPVEFAGHRANRGSNVEEKSRLVVETEGLPVSYFGMAWDEKDGLEQTRYICLEMMKGARLDPYPIFKAANTQFLPGTHEEKGGKNCLAAVGHGPLIDQSMAMKPSSSFEIRLDKSTASPTGDDFYRTLSRSFSGRGLADEPLTRALLGTSTSWPSRTRPMQVWESNDSYVYLDIQDLTPPMCDAIYDAMVKLDAYMPALDDEAPTIISAGSKGGPDPRQRIRALQVVSSSAELCAAIDPPFERWRSARAAMMK